MVYSIQTGGRKGSRVLSNNRAIVLHHGGQCRWLGGMKGWLIRTQQPEVNEYLVQANRLAPAVEFIIGLKGGFGLTPGKLRTLTYNLL